MNIYHFAVFMNRFLKRGQLLDDLHCFAFGRTITHALITLPASTVALKANVFWLFLADIKSECLFISSSNI